KNRLNFIGTAGITTGLLFNSTGTIITIIDGHKNSETYKDDLDIYRKINLFPTIGFGVQYKINNNLNIRAIPTFRYGVIDIISNKYSSQYLWNLGLEFGVFYGL
ncbi:MAG: hypothetical protein LBN23_00790, partial [Paludibacter sp.]|nr:hypothetical protein [Paludibacter sp.]